VAIVPLKCASGVSAGQPAWLVTSPGITGTSGALIGPDRQCHRDQVRPWIALDVELDGTAAAPRCAASHAAMSVTSVRRMCRSSARGCTVMPGAPAATPLDRAHDAWQRAAARLRSVATLLMLTESATMRY
jgi:hypothetical protein